MIKQKVAIVTDSTAYIPKDLQEQYFIHTLPQELIWGEKSYKDGVDIQPDEFYKRLSNAKTMPSSSQPTIKSIDKKFRELSQQGFYILAILISSKLSGTINSAEEVKNTMPEAKIEIFNSESTAMALGFQALAAARAAQDGADIKECLQVAQLAKENSGVVFAVNTLEFLQRGGRIGGGTRFLGTALNIKPILEVRDGRVEPLERVRTRKKSLLRIIEIIKERTAGKHPLRIATIHANAYDEANELLREASLELKPIEAILSEVSPVVGTHAGPGTIGLAYLTNI